MRRWCSHLVLFARPVCPAILRTPPPKKPPPPSPALSPTRAAACFPAWSSASSTCRPAACSKASRAAEGGYLVPLLPIGAYEVDVYAVRASSRASCGACTLAVNDRVQDRRVAGDRRRVRSRRGHRPDPGADDDGGAEPDRLASRCRSCRSTTATSRSSPSWRPASRAISPTKSALGLTSTMSISVNGARRNAVNWLVDGVMNVDVGSNITLLSTPTLESIEQFKIITSSYAAEWPRSGGGIINVVTKSGTSRYSGSGYEFFRNDRLNSNSYFRKQSTDPAIRDNAPELKYNNFGFTVGGPVLPSREKLFFFFSEELRRISRAPASLTATRAESRLADRSDQRQLRRRRPSAIRSRCGCWPGYPTPNTPPLDARRRRPLSGVVAQHQQHAAGSGPRGLRLEQHAAACGAATRTTSARRASCGGLFFNTRDSRRGRHRHERAGTGGARSGCAASSAATSSTSSTITSAATTSDSAGRRRAQHQVGVRRDDSRSVSGERRRGLIPIIDVTGLSTLGANQLFRIQYINHSFTDNFSWQRGNHAFKMGGLATFEQKNENAASREPGRLLVRRDDRRRHRVPEFPARQSRQRRAPAAATPRRSATSI